jgi:CHASE2 domain-containing sensor protein
MPRIFISYRREDSPANARLLHERLSAKFGASRVFMDVDGIDPGEEWRRRLDAEIERATHVLVLIGRRWLSAADAAGRRLDNPQDNVRWEVCESLRRGKRVIPVLVDQVGLPSTGDLPEPIRPLAEKNFFALSHLRFDKDVEALIEALSGEVPPAVQLRLMRAALLVVPLVAAGALTLARLDVFGIDAQAAAFTMALGDAVFESAINPDLLLIGLQPGDDEAAKLRPARRAEFARLIGTLSAAQVKTIVFDVYLTEATEFDTALGDSIRAARAAGRDVVFGFADITTGSGDPVAAPVLAKAGAALGVVCVGKQLNDEALATLALVRDEQNYPSLPLLAVYGPVEVNAVSSKAREIVMRDGQGHSHSLPFSLLQRFAVTDRECPARSAGSQMARLIIPVSHRERWRDATRRRRLDEVLDGSADAAAFSGKTVLVGVEHPRDLVRTRLDPAGPSRFGFEFQADAINALMNGSIVRPLGWLGQACLMLAMAGLAAAYRLWRLHHRRRFDKSALALAVLLYLVLILIAYAKFRVLINPVYHLAALLGAWVVLAQLEERWLREAD